MSLIGQFVSKVKEWGHAAVPLEQQEQLTTLVASMTPAAEKSVFGPSIKRSSQQLDLQYITAQLVAASQPAHASEPTFNDKGRDTWQDAYDGSGISCRQDDNESSSNTPVMATSSTNDSCDPDEGEQAAGESTSSPQQRDITSPTTAADAAISLDPHGSDIISPTPTSVVQDGDGSTSSSFDASSGSLIASPVDTQSQTVSSVDITPRRSEEHTPPLSATTTKVPRPVGNSAAALASFLEEKHRHHFLAFSLSDSPPDDRTRVMLGRQLVLLPWKSPGQPASETPTIATMLQICYALSAWLALHDKNIALVYCANGKTRTAIAIGCFLRFSGQVEKTKHGFCHFLERRCPQTELQPEQVLDELPASLHTFFRNFDSCMELGRYMNQKPLLLRAIALQGIPVEDKPCLDIWHSDGRHVYSSHAHLWDDCIETTPSGTYNQSRSSSQWADEEGFYKCNVILEGDFCLLCRFGGVHAAGDIMDTSKIIFRYANSTGFLGAGGPYELGRGRVDLMRRYAHFADDDFLLTLVLEAHWNCPDPAEAERLRAECSEEVLPPVYDYCSVEAVQEGWKIISCFHACQPIEKDVDRFLSLHHAAGGIYQQTDTPESRSQDQKLSLEHHCPRKIVSLALQLNNFRFHETQAMLLSGPMTVWWTSERPPTKLNQIGRDTGNRELPPRTLDRQKQRQRREQDARQQCLDILGEVDVTSKLNKADILFPDSRDDDCPLGTSESTSQSPPSPPRAECSGALPAASGNGKPGNITIGTPCSSHWMSSIATPHSGDIVAAFGAHPFTTLQFRERRPLRMGVKPLCPLVPIQGNQFYAGRRRPPMPPLENPDNEAAVELLMQLNHNGVSLQDLVDLVKSSRTWNGKSNGPDGRSSPFSAESSLKGQSSMEQAPVDSPPQTSKSDQPTAEETLEPQPANSEGDPPLEKDPKYEKYFRMLKTGLPKEVVRHALQRDGMDLRILEMDPTKSFSSQQEEHATPKNEAAPLPEGVQEDQQEGDPALKDDPKYEKYFRMLEKGLPDGAVRNALQRDGLDPSIMDLDPKKSLKSQTTDGSGKDVALKDDPTYQKYFKMLSMGLPVGAVKNALKRDGFDGSIADLDPEKSLKSQTSKENEDGPALKDDPTYQKYFKMLSMGLPVGAVKNALSRDGLDEGIIDLDPDKSLKLQTTTDKNDDGPALKDDPTYSKYFKMLSMGLPVGAVKNALSRDGLDAGIMDLDPEKSLKSQTETMPVDNGPAIKDDPTYQKYFKMLAMGLPPGAVKNALNRDGLDAGVLDLDPTKSLASQTKKSPSKRHSSLKKKKRVRRKKIYWTPIDPGKVSENSLWSMVQKTRVQMSHLNYDVKEFEDLFTESADPADQKKKRKKANSSKAKKLVQVIDGKRSMNGGIILLRLRMDYRKIRDVVQSMGHGKLDATQIKALKEFLPTDEERKGLEGYMAQHKKTEESKAAAYTDLSECEKYMFTMMDVQDAAKKFDSMLFRVVFRPRYDEIVHAIRVVEAACDEVRSSEKLRAVMAMILTLVNQINTGGDGNEALGFSLDALLKLNEVRAFDKRTSVLQYLVKLVKRNDESLLDFHKDLVHVGEAQNIILDTLVSDMTALRGELEEVRGTVEAEAERVVEAGETIRMSLNDLREQRSTVRRVQSVPQYNQIDNHTGRTPMERFTISAAMAVDDAIRVTEEVKEKYGKLLEYFGENEKMPSNEFFGTMRRFIQEFGQTVEKDNKEEKSKARAKRQNSIKASPRRAKAENAKQNVLSERPLPSVAKGVTAGDNPEPLESQSCALRRSGNGASSGIAAMAAAAAGRKAKEKSSKTDDRNDAALGIASLAASAARKTKVTRSAGTGNAQSVIGNNQGISLRTAGLAEEPSGSALIAAATARKSLGSKMNSHGGKQSPTLIATVAATAAAKAASKAGKENGAPSGVAAMAEAAAKKTQGNKLQAGSASGITVMAAAAAAKKTQGNKQQAGSASGIAAMAAAAALKKTQGNKPQASSASGIAAVAAATAAKKTHSNKIQARSASAMAAAAAATKTQGNKLRLSSASKNVATALAAAESKSTEVNVAPAGMADTAPTAATKSSLRGIAGNETLYGVAAIAAPTASKINVNNSGMGSGNAAPQGITARAAETEPKRLTMADNGKSIAAMAAAAGRRSQGNS